MTRSWRFEVPGKPIPLQRARINSKQGQFYTPAKSRNYQKTIHLCAKQAGVKPLRDGEVVSIEAVFYSKTAGRADIDNYVKALLDGLRRFFNDNKVYNLWAHKERPAKGEEERTVVYISYSGREKKRGKR